MEELSILQKVVFFGVPLIFAITVHEAAHGFVARFFGDRTAEMMGRLTLNPIKHIDPVGTILVPFTLLVISKVAGGGFLFGWAKPVPINTRNLRYPLRQMAWIGVAGPASNFVMALFWALVLRVIASLGDFGSSADWAIAIGLMAHFGIVINVVLAVLNLLPIPPLDGGRVAVGLLPPKMGQALAAIEPYGLFIVLALIFSGGLRFIDPLIDFFLRGILRLVGL